MMTNVQMTGGVLVVVVVIVALHDARLTAIFQDKLGKLVPECHHLLQLRMMEMVSGDNWSYRRAQLQLNRHHPQTNAQLFTGRMPFLSPNQQCQSTEEKKYHILRTCLSSLT